MVLVKFFSNLTGQFKIIPTFSKLGRGRHCKMVMVYFGCPVGPGSNLAVSKFLSNLKLFFETGQEEKTASSEPGWLYDWLAYSLLIWTVITTSSYKCVLWMSSLLLLFGAFNIHYKSSIRLKKFEIKLVKKIKYTTLSFLNVFQASKYNVWFLPNKNENL